MFDRLQKWMAKNKISPLMVLATMNVVLIVGFFAVLFLLIQAQNRPVSQTPQVIVLPNGDVTQVVTPQATSPEQVGDIQMVIPTLTVGPSPTAPSNPFDVGG